MGARRIGVPLFDDHRLFSDRQIEPVQRVASVVGAAIASSLLHQQSKQLAIASLRTSSDPSSRLLPILRRCVTEYRMRYNIEIQLHVDEASVLPAYAPEVETQIVRIVQEALTNVRKHAGTRLAWIHVRQDGGWLRITIQDDGCGFDPGQPGADGRAHYGLQIMRERAAGVGGSVEVRSHPGVGTRVQVRLPCEPDIARAL